MKAVIGVDSDGFYKPATELFCRLRFPAAEANLIYCIESFLPDGSFPDLPGDHPISAMYKKSEEEGREELAVGTRMLQDAAIPSRKTVIYGSPAKGLMEAAQEEGAELIGVGSAKKGTFGTLFFGSVTKSLAIAAKETILVGKNAPRSGDGLNVVVATDYSPYANRCMQKLISWGPAGIKNLLLITARQIPSGMVAEPADVPDYLTLKELTEANEALAERFGAFCSNASSKVVEAHPNAAITEAMQEINSDLLIMGAQGHGFLDRLAIGSISFHQVVGSPNNVLVIRS